MSLTQRECEMAAYVGANNARCVLWDDDPRGLGLRVFPSGRKSWVLSYRTGGGTKRLHTLGDFDVMKLAKARSEARAELVRIEREQADPQAEKSERRIEATTGTVRAMFEAYVEARRKDPRRPMKSADDFLSLGELHIFKKFGNRPWQEVRRSEVRDWHSGLADHPHQGNRALQALRAAYYWRLKQEDGDLSPAHRGRRPSDFRNPCAGVDLFPETPRQVRLELAQLPKLEAAIDTATDDPYVRAYFRFVLATGCRRSEALGLKWEDVTLDKKLAAATFRDTKTAAAHTVPLASEAAKLLKSLPRVKDNPFVFVGRIDGGSIVGIDKVWRKIRATAGVPGLRVHDLRRSFGSWLGDQGFSSKQIGSVLGHRTDITSRVYMALGDTSSRSAVNAAQSLMAKARKPKPKPKRGRNSRKRGRGLEARS
jgi:integrase